MERVKGEAERKLFGEGVNAEKKVMGELGGTKKRKKKKKKKEKG